VISLARAITGSLAAGFEVDGVRLACACHSGIALAPEHGATPEELLHNAELALAGAREQDQPGYGFFDPACAAAAIRRRDVQRAVTAAHAARSLRLVYQPIYQTRSGELAGFEALMRLEDPQLGPLSPAEFIPAAEQAGLIASIGDWALDEACHTAALWPSHLVVAVNLSPAQFLTGTIVSTIRQALERHALPAYRLEVEITEGTLMKESELVMGQLRVLRDMGVGVALDDFGTGYSSLGYLWRFPFSKLKIDRSFVAALQQSLPAKDILRSIVKLGHGLGMAVTAEGIENHQQLAMLRDLGCDLSQGYHLGRPTAPEELAAIIMQNLSGRCRRRGSGAGVTAMAAAG
jgi:EAL domain-containing protein (putative c-di-GMP-specific phosphodiesterase class I)